MAEEKKDGGSESAGGSGYDSFANVFFWILFALVAFSVASMALNALNISTTFPSLTTIFSIVFNKVQVFSIFLSLVFFIGIIYCNFKLSELHSHHGHDSHDHGNSHGHDSHVSEKPLRHAEVAKHEPNQRWQNVLHRISSQSEAEWRLAIIEADIILDDMLQRMGYRGEGIAERLKQVEKSDFKTIESAWEAHKIRNEIAHAGSSFKLSKGEAERAIKLFKEVFEEFYFV